ncbi:MerR family transcriptional regulator [Goodfellowiella coeruleoviolacea]|uniref:DNA-binding transcriptional regulator, MerR family n=1 Tax=Goodfellowiella coeruleoviolacea TaxID=334858 RepID=A0AAE3KGB6_9PSEU|nr:MerR family transcriptional regulator [Goodfellowiella coeruleoviolacea]MCP2165682.1 DNA-binding transcriptional regulator, MerR family [Goodfellowiella coeruleoviolacea]
MTDHPELFTIGQLARTTGLSVRTVRFWSDSGLVPPTTRSDSGYRLYDATAVARLDLVRTLRELGLDLDTVRQVLCRRVTVAEVAEAHAAALDAEIRTLTLRRAVLRAVAQHGSSQEEMRLMHQLAQMSAQQRQHIIDEFVDQTFAGIDADAPGAHIGQAMRQLPARLPDDPTVEQVNAWVELAELVADPDFRRRVREMAVAGARGADQIEAQPLDLSQVPALVGPAVAEGTAPDSAAGQAVLARLLTGERTAAERHALADELATFTDRRVERYWELLGVLNGWPRREPSVPTYEWLIAALRA